jgi:hypothetical protein
LLDKKEKLTADLAIIKELEGSASRVNLDGDSEAKEPVKIVSKKKL